MYMIYMFHFHSTVVISPPSAHPARISLPFILRANFKEQVLMFLQQLLCRCHVQTHFLTAQLLPNALCPQQEPTAVLQEGLLVLGPLQNVLLLLDLQLELCQKPLHVFYLLRDGPALCRVGVLDPSIKYIQLYEHLLRA